MRVSGPNIGACAIELLMWRSSSSLSNVDWSTDKRPGCHLPCNQWCDGHRGRRVGVVKFGGRKVTSAHLMHRISGGP
jgi:hypothetical protein